MKVALVHDYFTQTGGAERVVEVLHRMYPDAPIYTTVSFPDRLWPGLRDADIRTSWMQRIPGVKTGYRAFFPLYPNAIESLDLQAYDLVISSSSAYAKSAVVRSDAVHVCYCHTPMRFAWSYDAYVDREGFGRLVRGVLPPLIRRVRDWDARTADRVTQFVANSSAVRDRIRNCYGRDAEVVFPPVGVERYALSPDIDDYYLIVARFVPYKRLDLAVEAFNRMGRRLRIIGGGPGQKALEAMAGPTIEFTGRLSDQEVADAFARCRGLVFPGEEDFGIAPLEANASGRPVVAYAAGGALDTVVDGVTGVHFHEQTVDALCRAVERCEATTWDPRAIRAHADGFAEARFRERFEAVVERALEARRPQPARRAAAGT